MCLGPGSNRRPQSLQDRALPTELPKLLRHFITTPLLLRRAEFVDQLLPRLLHIRKLRRSLRSRALHLFYRAEHLIHDGGEVLHVEPYRREK